MSNEPDLLISAGFSDAKLVQEANKVLAFYRKKGEEAQKAFQDAQGRVTDTQALRAHERQMDRLGKAYDPVYRASKRYEKAVKDLDTLLGAGRISQKQYTAEVERAAREVQKAGQATDTAARKGVQMGTGWQNVGWQVGDFATQVGAGTSAVQALGQQMPQLLGGLGTMGALMGAGAAIAIPLGAALIRMSSNSKTLDERMEALNKTTSAYVEAAENAAIPVEELRRKYGGLAEEVARVNKLQAEVAGAAAKADLVGTSRAFASQFGGFGQGVDRANTGMSEYQATLNRLRRELNLTDPEARKVAKALQDIMSASDETELHGRMKALSEILVNLAGDADKANEKFGKLLSGDGKKKPGLFATLEEAQKQVGAAVDDAAKKAQEVIKQYETNTERLKKLSEDRKSAQTLLDEAIRKGGKDAIDLARQRLALIDLEISKTRELAVANDMSFEAMAKRLKQIGIHIADTVGKQFDEARKEFAGSSARFEAEYVARRASGAGSQDEELVRAVTALAEEMGIAAKDLLAVMSFETGGKLRPDVIGPTTGQGQHFGLIQFGDKGAGPRYGVSPDSSITEQVVAAGRYLQDAGVKAGDSLANIYAAVLAGDARKINASDLAAGGVVGNVSKAVNGNQFAPHLARAEGLLIAYGSVEDAAKKSHGEEKKRLQDEIRDRERLAKQAKEYGEQLSRNLLSEERQAELAKQQADQIAAIRASGMGEADQAAAIAQVNGEIEKQRTIYALLEEAKRRQVDLDAMLTDGSMTYRQAIEALGETKKQQIITDQQSANAEKSAAERIAYAKQAQEDFKNGMIDAIVAGESFSDVLSNLAQQFAKVALQAALFGQGPLSGGMGGFLSWLPGLSEGGYTGPGGKYEPAGVVHKGEVVWSQRDVARAGGVGVVDAARRAGRLPGYADGGVVAPVVPRVADAGGVLRALADRAAGALGNGGQSGGEVGVRVFVDESGNWQAKVEQISGKVSAQVVASTNRRQSDKQFLRGGR